MIDVEVGKISSMIFNNLRYVDTDLKLYHIVYINTLLWLLPHDRNLVKNIFINKMEPLLTIDNSIIDNTIIKDSDIFQHIGYKNYIQLNRKYPLYFKYFDECKVNEEHIGNIPGNISLLISDNPDKIKKDIVKTIYYGKWFSDNSDLVLNYKDKILVKPIEVEETTPILIFVFIIIVLLFIFATYIIIKSPMINNKLLFNEN